ncbi:MAG: CAP domain-containing protein [Cyanobacteria bacterium P01_G01_bin.39]
MKKLFFLIRRSYVSLSTSKMDLYNILLKAHLKKGFVSLGGIVLGTAIILGGTELAQFSSNSHSLTDSSIVIGSKPVNAQSVSLNSVEQTIYNQINAYRRKRGLAPLRLDRTMINFARRHSHTMASERVLRHSNPRQYAENVAYNNNKSSPGTKAVNDWIESRDHRRNLTGNYQLTGIGVVMNPQTGVYFFTQVFK